MMKKLLYCIALVSVGFGVSGQKKSGSAPASATNSSSLAQVGESRAQYWRKQVPEFAIQALANISDDNGNKEEVLNIRDFSGAMPGGAKVTPDAIVAANEDTARGTDVSPAIRAAMLAAGKGQFVFIGPGDWVVSGPIDMPVSKQINLICTGTLHFNKHDGFRITAPQGTDPQHHLFFYGSLVGRENMPKHSKQTHDAGTQPKWADMTNTAIDITNCDRNFILINRAEGFGNAVRINGGGSNGSQENTISFQFLYKNANGITLRSLDGSSFVDKNQFMGFYGGAGRISGGLAVKIDGYEGVAKNGEHFNGAFRSNEFHLMVEQVDSIMAANGDITEPLFDIVIESGVNTGVFGTGFQMRSVAPNFVRAPKYCGSGIFCTAWLTNGMGVGGTITDVPVYYNCRTLIGTRGITDETGNIVMELKTPLVKAVKDALPASIKTVSALPRP